MVEKASSLPGIVNQEGKIAGSGKDGKKGKYYGRRKIEERLERVMGRPQMRSCRKIARALRMLGGHQLVEGRSITGWVLVWLVASGPTPGPQEFQITNPISLSLLRFLQPLL